MLGCVNGTYWTFTFQFFDMVINDDKKEKLMPFFKSFPDDAGPPDFFIKYPEVYGAWSKMSQELMNGPSPLSQAERELILAYSAGGGKCTFIFIAHSEVAYARGIEAGLIDRLLEDPESAPVEERFKPLLAFVHKLMLTPSEMSQADANAVSNAGWNGMNTRCMTP